MDLRPRGNRRKVSIRTRGFEGKALKHVLVRRDLEPQCLLDPDGIRCQGRTRPVLGVGAGGRPDDGRDQQHEHGDRDQGDQGQKVRNRPRRSLRGSAFSRHSRSTCWSAPWLGKPPLLTAAYMGSIPQQHVDIRNCRTVDMGASLFLRWPVPPCMVPGGRESCDEALSCRSDRPRSVDRPRRCRGRPDRAAVSAMSWPMTRPRDWRPGSSKNWPSAIPRVMSTCRSFRTRPCAAIATS